MGFGGYPFLPLHVQMKLAFWMMTQKFSKCKVIKNSFLKIITQSKLKLPLSQQDPPPCFNNLDKYLAVGCKAMTISCMLNVDFQEDD